ncbi:MAG TPA: site-specific integrase [Bryobacteraceae bacterium]|nr:site-specific integrase [Bryobacteraceae bacterium]
MLRRAFKLGFQADPPMVVRIPHFPELEEHNIRTGYLKPQQYRKLLTELPEELRLLFVFGYHVGVRKGALLLIKWEQVDTEAGFVYMEKKRSGKHVGRVLPIYGDMAAFIEMQPHGSEYLFARGSEPIKDFRGSWKAACKRAGIPGLLFHDLRRTAVRNMRRAGIPESLIMKIIGHKTRSVFERYNIIDEDDIREAGRKTESFLSSEESAQTGAQNKAERKERFS